MQQETGKFISAAELDAIKRQFAEQYKERYQDLPRLDIGETVEIKGVKFAVKRIWGNGKLLLKMLVIPVEKEAG